jgi:hypothetical protein
VDYHRPVITVHDADLEQRGVLRRADEHGEVALPAMLNTQ